jgi:hypothetical protein
MIQSQRIRVRGVPYPHVKATGNVAGRKVWTDAIVQNTRNLRKVNGPCLVRVTFKLTHEEFRDANPFGTDLDNLLKRFSDALGQTVPP